MRISDWSSDVCSSDLDRARIEQAELVGELEVAAALRQRLGYFQPAADRIVAAERALAGRGRQHRDPPAIGGLEVIDQRAERRSEEGRGGKECVSTCRSRWSPKH